MSSNQSYVRPPGGEDANGFVTGFGTNTQGADDGRRSHRIGRIQIIVLGREDFELAGLRFWESCTVSGFGWSVPVVTWLQCHRDVSLVALQQ